MSQTQFEDIQHALLCGDQLRAFSVTQSSLKRIFLSSKLLAIPASYLDSVHRHRVIHKLAAINDFTTLHTYLSGTTTHDKEISQFFDTSFSRANLIKRTFHTAVAEHDALGRNTNRIIRLSLSQSLELLMAARRFVEAVFNSLIGPAELLYDHLVMVCFTITLYADNRLVYTDLSQKFNSQDMRICKGRSKAADVSTMPKVNTTEEALCAHPPSITL
ncbi:hypothetical protein KCU77_g195, partial [Aureobasidium melanogenum]